MKFCPATDGIRWDEIIINATDAASAASLGYNFISFIFIILFMAAGQFIIEMIQPQQWV